MKPTCKYPEYPGNWPNPIPKDPDTSGDDPLKDPFGPYPI